MVVIKNKTTGKEGYEKITNLRIFESEEVFLRYDGNVRVKEPLPEDMGHSEHSDTLQQLHTLISVRHRDVPLNPVQHVHEHVHL